MIHNDNQEDAFDSANDFKDGEFIAQEINESGVHNTIIKSNTLNKINEDSMNITLHNSFELLDQDTEPVIGEAKSSEKDSVSITLDMQIDKNPIMETQSKGNEILNHITYIEVPGNMMKKTSTPATLNPSISIMSSESGRHVFPTADSSSLNQGSNIGRLSFPNATTESLDDARDPKYDDTIVLQPINNPVTTTYEILGQDKRQVHFNTGPTNKNAACIKDGKILSKFWGAEDTDATDNTCDPETNSEVHKGKFEFPDIALYLESTSSKIKTTKRGKPKKKKSPINLNGTISKQKNTDKHGIAAVNTRSQTGDKSQSKHTISQ